jgi:uncharacterized membrane protein YkvA (DUF1232 family)
MNNDKDDQPFEEAAVNAHFEAERHKAEETLKDKEQTRGVIADTFEKLSNTAAKPIAVIKEDILLLLAVISAYITGKYKKIPFKTLAMILGALTYFLSPFDVILDFVPVIGFLDDVFVLTMVLKFAHDDLQAYKAWEAKTAKAEKDV